VSSFVINLDRKLGSKPQERSKVYDEIQNLLIKKEKWNKEEEGRCNIPGNVLRWGVLTSYRAGGTKVVTCKKGENS